MTGNQAPRAVRAALSPLRDDLSDKQVHLIRSAYRAIGKKGVHGISLQDVADVAWVSKGVLNYHFKSKENLVLATMRWALSRTAERINRAVTQADTPQGQVRAMIGAIFVRAEANREFYLIYLDLVDHAARYGDFHKLSATFQGIVNALYADVIEAGAAQGAFHVTDVDEAAKVVRAIIDGLFVQWIQENDWKALHRGYKDTCTRAVLSYLRASDPAPADGGAPTSADGASG